MNCKQGDLAVIIRAVMAENIGRFVTVGQAAYFNAELGHIWRVTPQHPMRGVNFYSLMPVAKVDQCPDAWLCPIRPNDGEDETLTWAGKPTETPTEIIHSLTEKL